jgi:hypothetical protein
MLAKRDEAIRRLRAWRVSWLLLGLSLAAGLIALVARAKLFPLMSGDSDAAVYRYQARMLAQGHVTLAARVHAKFFYPWLFGRHGDRLFSQYQPGWPAVIAAAHLIGNERVALVIAAVAIAVATWFLAQEIAPGSGAFAVILLLISPIFVLQAGLFLSYLWSAALVTGALASVLAGVRTRRPGLFLLGGILFGFALVTRPFDAFMVAALAGAYLLVALRRDVPALRRAVLWLVVGGVPFVLLTALYNAHVTGSFVRFPLQAAEKLDTFGFGNRKMARYQTTINYTPRLALSSLTKHVGSMSYWFAGSGVGLLLAAAAVVLHRRRREVWLVLAVVAVFPIGYFFWWATSLGHPGAAEGLGPRYYVPAFTCLAALGGYALHDLARRSRVLAGLGIAGVFVGSLLMVSPVLGISRHTTRLERAKAIPLTAPSLTNAVVIMRAPPSAYMFADNPFLVGDPRLRGRVLYAIDRGPGSAKLSELFPTRKLYQFVQRVEPGHSLLRPTYLVEPIRIVTGSTVTLRFNATATARQPVVVASVSIGGRTVASRTLNRVARPGEVLPFEVVLETNGADQSASRPDRLLVNIAAGGQVAVDVAFGPDGRRGPTTDIFERRYFVTRRGRDLAVQVPGLQYHRFNIGRVAWFPQDVGARLGER